MGGGARARPSAPYLDGIGVLARFPAPIQQIALRFIEQAEDPYPEHMAVNLEAEKTTIIEWGWWPVLTLACALGLFAIAAGFTAARNGQQGLEATFVIGLLLIFVPTMVRQLSPSTPRLERIASVCVLGLCLYLINVMVSPTYFSSYDEFCIGLPPRILPRQGSSLQPMRSCLSVRITLDWKL